MISEYEMVPLNDENPDPRVACVLLVDTSSSMSGAPIDELNRGYELFRGYLSEDELASMRADVTVVEFNSSARVAVPMQEGRTLPAHTFRAGGMTSMGAAIDKALDLIEARKAEYKASGVEYYRPWIVVFSDGSPTDAHLFESARRRLTEVQSRNGVTVFPIGIGSGADMAALSSLSTQRGAIKLAGVKFGEFFDWLSRSMSAVSQSQPPRPGDEAAGMTEQIQLPGIAGWATT